MATKGPSEPNPVPDRMVRIQVDVRKLHHAHPKISASDWRSPLILRLLQSRTYADDRRVVSDSLRDEEGTREGEVELYWSRLRSDFERRVNTFPEHRLTEDAALGLTCVLMTHRLGMELGEVTRLGEAADYWLGGHVLMLEVSGEQSGSLEGLLEKKRKQLLRNPHHADGYVSVADFATRKAIVAFYRFPKDETHDAT